jgi:hypothetical protein
MLVYSVSAAICHCCGKKVKQLTDSCHVVEHLEIKVFFIIFEVGEW